MNNSDIISTLSTVLFEKDKKIVDLYSFINEMLINGKYTHEQRIDCKSIVKDILGEQYSFLFK